MAAKKLTAAEQKLVAEIEGKVSRHFGKVLEDATPKMIYTACALTARDRIMKSGQYRIRKLSRKGQKSFITCLLSF